MELIIGTIRIQQIQPPQNIFPNGNIQRVENKITDSFDDPTYTIINSRTTDEKVYTMEGDLSYDQVEHYEDQYSGSSYFDEYTREEESIKEYVGGVLINISNVDNYTTWGNPSHFISLSQTFDEAGNENDYNYAESLDNNGYGTPDEVYNITRSYNQDRKTNS